MMVGLVLSYFCAGLTLDDSSNANRRNKASPTFSRVELLSLFLWLARSAQPPCVFHGNAVSGLWGWAVALGDDGFLNTHCAYCSAECSNGTGLKDCPHIYVYMCECCK